MCVLSIIRKKSGNLSYAPRINIYIYIYIYNFKVVFLRMLHINIKLIFMKKRGNLNF